MNTVIKSYRHTALICLIILTTMITACRESIHQVSRPQLGTIINLTIIADDTTAARASSAAFDEIERIEKLMSPVSREGDVWRINTSAQFSPVTVSADTFLVLDAAQGVSRESGGAFDVSFASLAQLWNYKSEHFLPPREVAVRSMLPLVDYRNIILDASKRTIFFRRRGMKIGLGGIAKGYAVRRAMEVLKEKGVRNAIVEEGGDLLVVGSKYGKPWVTGLRHPREPELLLAIAMPDGESVATSGDYERFAEYQGKRYHHIIDPRTGYPAETLASVSVLCNDPMLADVWATALFVMGRDAALKVLEKKRDISVILVDKDMGVTASRRLKENITLFVKGDIRWI